jgi:hypothetical protein
MNIRICAFNIAFAALYIIGAIAEEEEVPGQLSEEQRLIEYHKRGYTWPPEPYVPVFMNHPWMPCHSFSNL